MIKIAIIGAGSVEFTRNILTDLCSSEELRGSVHVALHDIDPERLAYAERAAAQVVERLGAGQTITAHADRREAFDGANYLINEIQVGGYAATVTDFDIPKRYGLRQTIADTIGIGGIMRGLRTIPVMIEMGDEMAELCPDGLLLNYTNPMAMVPWGIWAGSRWPAARTIGVCHSVRDTHTFLAETVGVPEERIEFRTAGFNHQCFVYGFADRETGEDLYPRLRKIVEDDPDGLGRRVRVELFRRFGYFPTESSEHSAEYVPWFLHHDDEVAWFRSEIDEYVRRSDENLRGVGGAEGAARRRRGRSSSSATTSWRRSSCSRWRPGTPMELYGNVRNDALIDGLPDDACVEVPCVVADGAVQPQRIGAIPPQCLALNRTFLNVVELTVRAVLEGSRDLVHQAALLDPNTAATLTTRQIAAMVDDLLDGARRADPRGDPAGLMRALVKHADEVGLRLEDVPEPEVGINDVAIHVERAGICGTDVHIWEWNAWARSAVTPPLVVGHEFVGRIAAVGSNVTDFHPGDRVSGEGHVVCGRCRHCLAGRRHLCANSRGVGVQRPGAFADTIVLPVTNVWKHADDVDPEVAAIFDPFGNAVHTALSTEVLGEDILITGAGPIGCMAAAVVRHAGARFVVVSEPNPYRRALAERMGATVVIDPAARDLHDVEAELGMVEGFDVGPRDVGQRRGAARR